MSEPTAAGMPDPSADAQQLPVLDRDTVARYQFHGQDVGWLLDQRALHRADHPFLVWEPADGASRTWTYAEFAAATKEVAAGLAARGVGAGDSVLIHAENCPEAAIAWYAVARLGGVSVTTNTRSVAAELSYFIEHSGAVGAITQPKLAPVVAEAGGDLAWVVVTEDNSGVPAEDAQQDHGFDGFDTLTGDPDTVPELDPDPLRPVSIMFTSGTTSKPKAVVHTHGNVLWAAKVNPTNIDFTPDDTYLCYLPFFHVNTQGWAMWTVLGAGGTVVLQPKFSASRFWSVIAAHEVSHISLIPFVFKAIGAEPIPEHTVRVGVFGLIMPFLDEWLGMRVMAAYGMTELVGHCIRSTPNETYPDMAMGRVAPGYEMMIVNHETGRPAEVGEMGELWIRGVRGISVFQEYLNNPEANAKMFTEDGWCRTGDVVRLEADGNIFYCDRDKDALKVGGENVSAREVEDVCRTVPGIDDIAVVAKSHEMLDMVPVAFVVRNPAAEPEEVMAAAIIDACKAALADFKVPRAVYFTDEFPTAELGKISKKDLRDLADSYDPV
ncbi:MAG: class I adenylate-forming enzyme family protein [Microthrixaceae bacterium]